MRRASLCAMILLLVLVAESRAFDYGISISPVGVDAHHLPVNTSVTFNVDLAKFTEPQDGWSLNYFGVIIAYNSALLNVSSVDAGNIIPNTTCFTPDLSEPGKINASYWSSDSYIGSTGKLFSFTANVLKTDSDVLSFQLCEAGTPPNGDVSIDGASLGIASTPEPSGVVLLITAALAAFAYLLRRSFIT